MKIEINIEQYALILQALTRLRLFTLTSQHDVSKINSLIRKLKKVDISSDDL